MVDTIVGVPSFAGISLLITSPLLVFPPVLGFLLFLALMLQFSLVLLKLKAWLLFCTAVDIWNLSCSNNLVDKILFLPPPLYCCEVPSDTGVYGVPAIVGIPSEF
jgi:hypothetical protein